MKNFVLFLIVFSVNNSFSQYNWQEDNYSEWDHTNFRQNQVFNQPFSTSNPDYLLLDAAVFYLTNEERSKAGVYPLGYHKLLEIAAYNHSLKMAKTGFFSHENPIDGSRYSTSDRGKLAGVTNPSFAENIATFTQRNGSTYLQVATKLVNQWMNSSGHRKNILSREGRQMAAGTYYHNGEIYGTQVFQWFSDVIESPYGGRDQLPNPIIFSNEISNSTEENSTKTYSTTTQDYNQNQYNNTANNLQIEVNQLKDKVATLNSNVSEKEGTISKLNREITNLKNENSSLKNEKTNLSNSVNNLQQEQWKKDSENTKLQNELNLLSNRRTSVKKSKYNASDFHAFTFKLGLNTFYPSINPINFGKFNSNFLSFAAETMFGVNIGDSYRRNSVGLTLRASQANRFLTKALDSTSVQPIQYYDAELTSIIREWLSFGIGASIISSYGSSNYEVLPSASMGLCLGPKTWKIQLTQQVTWDSKNKFLGRAFVGIALKL
jgi:uncharacterized protein YkwD/FtsZ-binding cell division protein ZapB